MDCSIIIINFNTFDLTLACIKSILEKTDGIKYEIILVDNASSECAPEMFEEIFPQVILLKSNENLGFSRGNNLGIKQAKGKYILLLNSDTVLLNNAVFLAIKKMESDKTIGALSSMLVSPNHQNQYPAERFPSFKTELFELFRLNKRLTSEQRSELFLGSAFDHLTEHEADWIWGAFFLIPKDIISQFGGLLPDDYFMYAEDMDWCWKIKKMGFRIWYLPCAKVLHYGGASLKYESSLNKFFDRMFPNRYRVLSYHKGNYYAWFTYLVKAIHLLTLRRKIDFKQALFYFKFLFSKKSYWLTTKSLIF